MEQTVTIPCKGGLNLSATNSELLSMMNEAIRLVNMESSKAGGYRRISGFAEWGTTTLPGGVADVKGILAYRGGVLAAKGNSLYHSFDGITWTVVNATYSAGANKATVDAATLDPLTTTNEKPWYMKIYTEGTQDHVYIATGNSDPLYLLIEGTSDASAAYTYREVALSTELTGAKYLTLFENQVILANTTADPTSFIYSSFATTDLSAADISAGITIREKYDGSTAGVISAKRPITGIKAYRNSLYIFTENTISKVSGLVDGNVQVIPVTENIGCVAGETIREIGGDLLFLSYDGIRTIAGTVRNEDVELGVISRKIAPLTDNIMNNLNTITFSSCVITSKNQYRLWYKDSTVTQPKQKGIIASFAYDSTSGSFRWDFSELLGWTADVCDSGKDLAGEELLLFGNEDGKVYQFETGNTFDSTVITWIYQSPYGDFGDIGYRKAIHEVRLNTKLEGSANPKLYIKYDYDNITAPQPLEFPLSQLDGPSIYGEALYGNALFVYGSSLISSTEIYAEGSGHTVSFRIQDCDLPDAPFEIQSIQVNFTATGRQ